MKGKAKESSNKGFRGRLIKLAEISTIVIPGKFVRHYVKPVLIDNPTKPYDARRFFESYHRSYLKGSASDGETISHGNDPLFTRYHYNAVENSILEYMNDRKDIKKPKVLDIGSGAGHWIDFYKTVFDAQKVLGLDISPSCIKTLNEKYAGDKGIVVKVANVTDKKIDLGMKFDIINAVGVMFHIVEDDLWLNALKNFKKHLRKNGVIIIGGQFGLLTQNVEFHNVDDFGDKNEYERSGTDTLLFHKRIRSLRYWKKNLNKAGLRTICLIKTRQDKEIDTPENNILVIGHK